MNWTTEYPKEPGYYWIRNYTVQRYYRQEYFPDGDIVWVDSSLNGHIEGEDPVYFMRDLVSAEWFGPIQPPAENEHRRGLVMSTRCAWCKNVASELIQWTAQGTDAFYHSAVVCRECYDKVVPNLEHQEYVDAMRWLIARRQPQENEK